MVGAGSQETLEDKLRGMPSERLLAMRAEGDMLADEWHRAIEGIFEERNEYLPPIPSQPVVIEQQKDSKPSVAQYIWRTFLAVLILVIGEMIRKMFGLILVSLFALWYVAKYIRRSRLSEQERSREKQKDKADKDGLNELMRAAATGDATRVRELLDFRAVNINATSSVGSTALMYAARNGHTEIVEALLRAGADPHIRSDKGSTAEVIARRFGHQAIADRLRVDR
jgi:hypothetical protein